MSSGVKTTPDKFSVSIPWAGIIAIFSLVMIRQAAEHDCDLVSLDGCSSIIILFVSVLISVPEGLWQNQRFPLLYSKLYDKYSLCTESFSCPSHCQFAWFYASRSKRQLPSPSPRPLYHAPRQEWQCIAHLLLLMCPPNLREKISDVVMYIILSWW